MHRYLVLLSIFGVCGALQPSLRPSRASRVPAPPRCCEASENDWATVPPEGGWANFEYWEDAVSCVEYSDTSGDKRLGVYTAYTIDKAEPHITPLCAMDEDEGIACLFCNEDTDAVPLSAVSRILDPDYVFVSERNIIGPSNPHGEHSETVYDLSEVEISDDITLVLNEDREH